MAQKQQQLRDVGSKLENPPASKDALIKLLKQAANLLSEIEQSPLPSMLDSMKPCLNATVKQELLKHQDKDVKVLLATCFCEITRITAPEAPYSDDVLRDIFRLIIGTFSGLRDINSPSFGRRVVILEMLARYRSCIVMLDLECDDLINEMFNTFFSSVSVEHPKNVLLSMQKIMVLVLDESEDIPDNLLSTILSPLGRKRSVFSLAAWRLAMDVIGHCAGKLEPCIKQFLVSSMSGDSTFLNISIDYHEVIFDLYQCAPHILSGVVPYVTGELLADVLDVRLKAVQLLGEIFALPGVSISESFQPLLSEFLKRLTDRVAEVRVSAVEHLKNCLISDPSRPEAPLIIKALCDRLLDYNENVRKQVVAAVYDVACHAFNVIPEETIRLGAERLRDKSLSVKTYTMERLADLYKFYCLKSIDSSASVDELAWIPGKILRCLYDKDFRSEAVELMLCGSLFPPEFSMKDRLKHWVMIFSVLDKVEVKALEQVLFQKQRLQQEMQKYLLLRQTDQEDAPELQRRISACFRLMSRSFSESTKAEESFQILNQLKDVNIWKMLTTLLDPCTSFHQACSCRDELLKILGEKHPLYDFMGMLTTKCSYLLFNKEYVKDMLVELSAQKSAGDDKFISSCIDLLVIIACFSPQLFAGQEENLVQLLKEDSETIKEGIAHVLAKAGGTIREQLASTTSSVDLLLERLCLEGSRKQAKYSVHALAAITEDNGLKSLSVLYKRLVDMLEEKTHLRAILQSLGCIAQIAMPVFGTREDEIVGFVMQKILKCSNKTQEISNHKTEWNGRSELCMLKIFSIKTLVKSHLPVRDTHVRDAHLPVRDSNVRPGFEKVMEILKNILSFGEISEDIESSAVDKAHMRLASAKAVLRLSRQWDHKIPLDVFHMTLRVSDDIFSQSRKLFTSKVHQYIKERLLDAKYACALLLNINNCHSPEYTESKHNLLEIIQVCQQAKVRQLSMQNDGSSTVPYPECILAYLVHALSHHPSCPNIDECKDVKAFEPLYWPLHLFLSVLLHGDGCGQSGGFTNKMKESYAAAVSIFNNIKCSEDVDRTNSMVLHAICDLGLSIAKRFVQDETDISGITTPSTLPSALFKPAEKNEDVNSVDNGDQSWLGAECVLAHFEALTFEDKEKVASTGKDELIIEGKDGDDNEIPLGKMMKILKSQGTKKKKNLKKRTTVSVTKDLDSEIDVLGVVREINLDSMKGDQRKETSKLTKENDLFNGHPTGIGNNNKEASVFRKRKEPNGTARFSVPTPKRKRSASTQRTQLKSPKGHISKEFVSYSRSNKMDEKKDITSGKKKLMKDDEPSNLGLSTIKRTSIKDADVYNFDKAYNDYPKKSPGVTGEDKKAVNLKSSTGSPKKRKVRSVSVLAKCSSQDTQLNSEELVGSRIKVWWSLDKAFYEGVIQSYDSGKKKHVVLYDDGDVEKLSLDKEKWEPIADDVMPRKKSKTQESSSHKEKLHEKASKKSTLSNSKQKKKSPKTEKVQRRSAPKKHTEPTSKDVAKNNSHRDGSGSEEDEIIDKPAKTLESPKEGKPSATSSHDEEVSDDEPLSTWTVNAGKGA